jgi:peptidoglycan/xylan/chitin deacetylase (PgdA/CDA1 family)
MIRGTRAAPGMIRGTVPSGSRARLLGPSNPLKPLVKRLLSASARFGGTITHVRTAQLEAALTFDDGPDPRATPRLLELLEAHGARATFFMVGEAARRHPEIVRRAAEAGHAIGNHTWDHPSLPLLRAPARRLQIRWCARALAPWETKLFRPPWGHQSLGSRRDAVRLGYRVVTWSLMAEDWLDDPAERLAERVRARLHPGAIVLFHDALYRTIDERYRDRSATVAAVELLLRELSGRYRFLTVPELLARGRPARWHWYKRPDLDWLERQV